MRRLDGFQKGLPYQVGYGYCWDNTACFATFSEALTEYNKHKDKQYGAVVVNLDRIDYCGGPDGGCEPGDGLTDEEREQL